MPWRIIIDRSRCIGAGTCVLEAPALIALDDDDRATVIGAVADDPEAARFAAEGCPVGAIRLEPGPAVPPDGQGGSGPP